jgi:hypothetical protein
MKIFSDILNLFKIFARRIIFVNMIDNTENKKSTKDYTKVSDDVVKQIRTESLFWNSILEFIMEFKDTKTFQWINKHPQLSLTLLIIWGLIIMGTFFTFVIFIIIK